MARARKRVAGEDPAAARGDELVVRFAAPDRAALERVASDPLPGGRDEGEPSTELFRDVYYDTPELDLRRRGATAGVRFYPSGELTLAVEVRDGKRRRPASAATSGRGPSPEALFSADDEAGALLRALVDPARLRPWLEVETRRRVRAAVLASDDGPLRVEVACDERMVRDRDVSAELFEVEVRLPDDTPAARAAARTLEQAFGLSLLTGDPLRRWTRSLEEIEVDWLEEAVRSARRVAVVVYHGGRVALLRQGDTLEVPAGPGTGIDAARRVLRERLGAEGRVRFMGTGPGSARQPATEVWMTEDAEIVPDAAGVLHLPIDELIRAAGSPSLRDDATLAALHVLARSDIPVHPLSPAWVEHDHAARNVLRAAPALPVPPSALPPGALPAGTLLNPELSVLAFNRRVLELAGDPEVPLLERVRFLSIFGGNLDEFFRVRVAGYKREVVQGSTKLSLDGVAPREQLDAVGTRARRLADAAYRLLFDRLLPELREHGIEVVRRSALDAEERAQLREYYDAEVHALVTPLAAGPGHPFPHIRNQRPSLVALLREPLTGSERLGVVELPDGLPRFVPLDGKGRFATLETVIVDNLHRLYPGMEVDAASTFRVTRSAELLLDRTRVVDLLEAVEEEVQRRRSRPVVRVEVEDSMTERLRALLLRELRLDTPEQAWPLGDEDVYEVEGLIDLRGLRELASLEVKGGHWPAEPPREPLDPKAIVDVLRRREVLVEFPRDSFEATVERFVLEAAEDPDVVAVKLALYRTNRRSRIVEALQRASSGGKQVVALVELTARFDEERNIEWARYLRSAGIHVVYGMPGLKVHAKVALVVRREKDGVRRYAYVGTGNLNATTAAAYTDLGLLTADPGITDEVAELFNALTAAGNPPRHRLLLVAPSTMRDRFVEMIDREVAHVRAGRGGHVVAKVNGLADRDLIAALYRASEAGVRVELIVRSLCALRPGVAGLSENIRVVSVLGRYLEHARIFRFANGGDPEYYIGSADWRTRNLSGRVEVACPVRDPEHRARLDAILEEQLAHPRAWELGSDGTYYRRPDRAPRDPALPPPEPGRVAIITG
ncbi:MAG: polyphosphate kinase 1 [Longimicrobiaceae bacterium]